MSYRSSCSFIAFVCICVPPLSADDTDSIVVGLSSRHPSNQIEALKRCVKLKPLPQRLVGSINSLILSNNPEIRAEAVRAAGNSDSESSVDVVSKMVEREDNEECLISAASTICIYGPRAKKAIPALVAKLKSRNSNTALACDDPFDFNDNVDCCILKALVCIGPDSAVPLTEMCNNNTLSSELRHASGRTLLKLGQNAKPALNQIIQLASESDAEIRATMLQVLLVAAGNSDVTKRVIAGSLIDSHTSLRIKAAELLYKTDQSNVLSIPVLVDVVETGTPDERWQAIYQLGKIGPKAASAVHSIARHLDSQDMKLRAAAARALGRVGPEAYPAIPALKKNLDNPDAEVQSAAKQALKKIEITQ
jgi:HEAT repeat protein